MTATTGDDASRDGEGAPQSGETPSSEDAASPSGNDDAPNRDDGAPGEADHVPEREDHAPDVTAATERGDGAVILFDGVCNLCNGFVQFVLPRDPAGYFRFASLQSEVGQALLAEYDRPTDELESVVLIEDGEVYGKSAAVIRIAASLGGVYRLCAPLRYVPRRIGDLAYDFVAARRYRWFGTRDRCRLPEGEFGDRFLE